MVATKLLADSRAHSSDSTASSAGGGDAELNRPVDMEAQLGGAARAAQFVGRARQRRGAVSVASDTPLTAKQIEDVRQAIFVSLGPTKAKKLLGLFEGVTTLQVAQQFVAYHEDELGLLGRIQAATALSTSLETWQANQAKARLEMAVSVWGEPPPEPEPEPEPELTAEEQAALTAAEDARRALEAEEARRRASEAAAAARRAVRRALSREDRMLLDKAEKELAAAKSQLAEVSRRLVLLEGQEADILRQLAEGGLTAEQEATLRARLEKVRSEMDKMKRKQKSLRDRIARAEANLRLILAGGGAQLREKAAENLDNALKGEVTRTRPRSAGAGPQRNPYAGTRWDPGRFGERAHLDRSSLSPGLGFASPLQCPQPLEQPKNLPGSALLVQRSPSAEERILGHARLLAAEHRARSFEMRYIAPHSDTVRAAKMARKWEKLTARLVQRVYGAKPLGSAYSLLEPDDGGRFDTEHPFVSPAAISAAADIFVGTAPTHPVLAVPLVSARRVAEDVAQSKQMMIEHVVDNIAMEGQDDDRWRNSNHRPQPQHHHSAANLVARRRPTSAREATTRQRPSSAGAVIMHTAVPAAVAYSLSVAAWEDTVLSETAVAADIGAVELQNSSEGIEQQQLAQQVQGRPSPGPPTAALDQYLRIEVKPTPPTARRTESMPPPPHVAMARTEPPAPDPWVAIELELALGREERRQQAERRQNIAQPPTSVLFQTGGLLRGCSQPPRQNPGNVSSRRGTPVRLVY